MSCNTVTKCISWGKLPKFVTSRNNRVTPIKPIPSKVVTFITKVTPERYRNE